MTQVALWATPAAAAEQQQQQHCRLQFAAVED
jgi:hypothetical protein